MKLSENAIKYINNYFENYSHEDCHVYEDYSGRGMFGSTTDALVVNYESDYDDLREHAESDGNKEVLNFLDHLGRRDSLGLSIIMY